MRPYITQQDCNTAEITHMDNELFTGQGNVAQVRVWSGKIIV